MNLQLANVNKNQGQVQQNDPNKMADPLKALKEQEAQQARETQQSGTDEFITRTPRYSGDLDYGAHLSPDDIRNRILEKGGYMTKIESSQMSYLNAVKEVKTIFQRGAIYQEFLAFREKNQNLFGDSWVAGKSEIPKKFIEQIMYKYGVSAQFVEDTVLRKFDQAKVASLVAIAEQLKKFAEEKIQNDLDWLNWMIEIFKKEEVTRYTKNS